MRHFVIQVDDVILHCTKAVTQLLDHNSLLRAPHPPSSPDLESSNFWHVGYFKRVLQASSFDELDESDESDELLSAIQKI
jgi:hypothetical protein